MINEENLLSKLQELDKVNEEIELLELKKKKIREQILKVLKEDNLKETYLQLQGKKIRLKWNKTTKVKYNEELLKQRLGDRIISILKVDYNKFKKYPDIEKIIPGQVLVQIGNVNKDLVKQAIKQNIFEIKDFSGAFTKEEKETLYVTEFKDGQ